MRRIHKRIAAAFFLLALDAMMFACSAAAPTDAPHVSTSQSITCQSDGVHLETVCSSPNPLSPPATCETDTLCRGTVESGDPYPVPALAGDAGKCVYDDSFSAQLQEMGCTHAVLYTPNTTLLGIQDQYFYISWCPQAPVDTEAVWSVIDQRCNTCTGQAPHPGWVLVAWGNQYCSPGMQPGGGCNSKNCLSL